MILKFLLLLSLSITKVPFAPVLHEECKIDVFNNEMCIGGKVATKPKLAPELIPKDKKEKEVVPITKEKKVKDKTKDEEEKAKKVSITEVKFVRVIDGDTIKVDIVKIGNIECKIDFLCKDMSIRIKGIDTPELNCTNNCQNICEKERKKEKEREFACIAKESAEQFFKEKKVTLTNCDEKKDEYGRPLCDVLNEKGKDFATFIQKQTYNTKKLAIPYHGKGNKWRDEVLLKNNQTK